MISLSKTVAKQLVSNENDSSTAGAAVFLPPSLSLSIAAPGPILSLNLEGMANSLGGTHRHDNCLGYAISLLYDPGKCIRKVFILQRSGVKKAGLVYTIMQHLCLYNCSFFVASRLRIWGTGPKSLDVVAPSQYTLT